MISRNKFNAHMAKLVEDIFEREIQPGKAESIYKNISKLIDNDEQMAMLFDGMETYNGRSPFPRVADFIEKANEIRLQTKTNIQYEPIVSVECPGCNKSLSIFRETILTCTSVAYIVCPNMMKTGDECGYKIQLDVLRDKMKTREQLYVEL